MCHTGCADNSIAVYDIPKCAGLCDPVKGFRDAAANPLCVTSYSDHAQQSVAAATAAAGAPRLRQGGGLGAVDNEHSVADLVRRPR